MLFFVHCFFLIKIYYIFNATHYCCALIRAGSFVRDQPTVSRSDIYIVLRARERLSRKNTYVINSTDTNDDVMAATNK